MNLALNGSTIGQFMGYVISSITPVIVMRKLRIRVYMTYLGSNSKSYYWNPMLDLTLMYCFSQATSH